MAPPAGDGETGGALIRARSYLVETPFQIKKGKNYRFSATGRWTDIAIRTSASGYSFILFKLFERWSRKPFAKWFSVIGQLDGRKDTMFDIGKLIEDGAVYQATDSGVLHCFANDLWFMYWSNTGAINLRVEEE